MVILFGVGRNPERGVVLIHNNVGLISENWKDIATVKLQVRQFQMNKQR